MSKIFIHGLGQSVFAWDGVKKYIEGKAKYINLLKREDIYEDIYKVLYNLLCKECDDEYGKVDLCGLSLGGVLAMQYAIEFPEKVRSLVLINSPYQVSDTLLNLQKYIFKLMPSVLFKQGFSKMDCLKIIDAVKEKNSIKVSSIKIPTLIIYGEKDSINKKSAFKLSRDIKDSKLIEIKKSNHQINIEQPKKLADEINIFWRYINEINMK